MNRELFNDMLNMCRTYYNKYGYFPTVREIGSALDIHSTSTVAAYLKRLEEAGFIETHHPESPRAYRFVDSGTLYGIRRYRKPTEKDIAERIAVQKAFNNLSENRDVLNNKLDEICSLDEHGILVKLIGEKTDNGRCELLKNLEYYGNPCVMQIFDKIEE